MRTLRASIKLFAFIILTITLILPQIFWVLIAPNSAHAIPRLYHNILCWFLGIRIQTKGELLSSKGTVYVSNHISYLDIIIYFTRIRASFIAKSDVAKWPVFGFLAKISQTIFIERTKAGLKNGSKKIEMRLKQGRNLILFPEGTSTNGREVLPFKSGFFQVLLGSEYCKYIQPISIQLSTINDNKPREQQEYDHYAWYADMTLVPHLWKFFTLKSCGVLITYHEPIMITADMDRKLIAKKCEEAVSNSFKNE